MQALGLLAIDGHDELRIVGGEGGEEAGQIFAWRRLAGCSSWVALASSSRVWLPWSCSSKLEAAELAHALDGRRQEGEHQRAGDAEERPRSRSTTASAACSVSLALGPRLELDEDERLVGRAAAEAEAGDRRRCLRPPGVLENRLHLLGRCACV